MRTVVFKNMQVKTNNKIDVAYGLYISLSAEMWEQLIEISKLQANHKADVHLEVMGKAYEFTFDEFFGKLGIETP